VALEDVEIPVVEAKEADLKIQFREFFKTFKDKQGRLKYWNKILDLAIKGEKSLIVDFPDLLLTKPDLALKVLEEPRIALEYASEALKDIVRSENPELVERTEKFYVRFRNLPRTIPIRKLGADHIEKLVQIEGIITRMTPVIQRLYKAVFKCMECGSETEVIQEGETIEYPEFCSFCEEKRRPRIEGGRKARSQFKLLLHKSKFINMQKIMVQEKPEDVPPGHMPRSVEVILLEDLVDKARPGDRVTVVGVLTVKGERSVKKGTKLTFEMKIETNNLEVSQKVLEEIEISKEDERKILELAKDPKIREKIIQSIAPAIHGYDHIKKAIALLLFGGVPKELPDGTRIRGDIHILLVGDPGVAKSQILQYVARIAPRGLYTSGKGSSAAGLTAAVIRDKSTGEYFLEAGALVLADGGVCAIDEIDKMRPEDRVAIHEAMEQQTISIAKAGIVARLNARAAILAAGNPKFGRYIEDRLFTENINLPPTILSRFDLIFVMRDKPEPQTDEELVSHILTVHKQYEHVKPPISPSMLRKYIGYARKFVKPRLTEEAAKIISEFFVNLRSKASEHPNAPIPITPRQLEAIIRLAEAHARMVLRNEVTAEDAKAAIDLMVKSFKDVGLDIEAGVIDIDVIMTGKPLSRRSKMMKVMEIIEKIEEYPGAEVRKSDVVEQAVKAGLSAEEVEEIIEQLRRDGILYEPKPGRTIARTV